MIGSIPHHGWLWLARAWLTSATACFSWFVYIVSTDEEALSECRRSFDRIEQYAVLVDACKNPVVRQALLEAEHLHDWRQFLDRKKRFSGGPD